MASNDTAALVVALSAQVSKFQKDMDEAFGIADKSIKKIENRFAAANNEINRQLLLIASNLAGQLGPIGAVLTSLGPAGLAAAVGLGALVLAFKKASEAAHALADQAKAIRDLAASAGLSTTEVQALSSVFGDADVKFDTLTSGLEFFARAMEGVRRQSGPLVDELLRINPALNQQLQQARSTAEGIKILEQAFKSLDTQQSLMLARAAFGRQAGADFIRALREGLNFDEAIKQVERGAKGLSESVIKQLTTLDKEIDQTSKRMNDNLAKVFSIPVLQAELAFLRSLEEISKLMKGMPFDKLLAIAALPLAPGMIASIGGRPAQQQQPGPLQVTVNKEPTPAAPLPETFEARFNAFKRQTDVLGEAATQSEKLKLKQLELAAAVEKNAEVADAARRAQNAFNLAMAQAVLAVRERLGIATEEQIVEVKLAELNDLRAKGFIKNAQDMAAAERVIAKEAKAAAEAQQVRASSLPNLKQLGFDAANVAKQLDQLATTSVNGLVNALGDVVSGSAKASDAFRNLGIQVIKSLTEMVVKLTIVGPLVKALEQSFKDAIPGGSLFGIPIPGHAGGTDFAPGGLSVVGESGPELLNIPRGSQVIPNSVLSRGGLGGDMNVNLRIDLTGANGDEAVRRIARQEATLGVREAVAIANAAAPARQLRFNQLGT